MKRTFVRAAKISSVSIAALVIAYFFPALVVLFLLCGIWDVSRNRELDWGVAKQYFFKNGITTWLASPINILLDALSLPFINKGVYELDDLPESYRDEIRGLMKAADDLDLVGRLQRQTEGLQRAMYFFKWYGRDLESDIDVPEFHREYNYVRTIGVSMFRGHESTSRHFGPFRPSLRVLYCLNEIKDEGSYIKVGPVENHWKRNRLFIFDDTLLHQSFNRSDEPRYVLFVDILRPSYLRFVFEFAVTLIRMFFKGFNGIFYKNWKLVNQ